VKQKGDILEMLNKTSKKLQPVSIDLITIVQLYVRSNEVTIVGRESFIQTTYFVILDNLQSVTKKSLHIMIIW